MKTYIKGFEGIYSISRDGTIINEIRGNIKKPTKVKIGYLMAALYKDNKETKAYIHRLIAEHFIPNDDPINKTQVNHINGNKKDNNIDNLELVSNKANVIHAYKIGLKKGNKGITNSNSKLTEEQARTLIAYLITTDKPNKWYGDLFGLHPNYVSLIKHKKRWKHIWEEIEGSTTIHKEYTQVSGSGAQFNN